MPTYKVLREGDRFLTGAFDPEELEQALNKYAAEGWRVVNILHTQNVWKSINTKILVILEHD